MIMGSLFIVLLFTMCIGGIIPPKVRYIWLVITSYLYYAYLNRQHIFLLIGITLVTYLGGIILERVRKKKIAKIILILSITAVCGVLFYYKYFEWIVNSICAFMRIKTRVTFGNTLPLGLSFYSFQAIGYIIDIWKEKIKAERNVLLYALFLSFFPIVVSGPIENAQCLLPQLRKMKDKAPDIFEMRYGILLILYGMFLKLVIADRLAIYVNNAFDNYQMYGCLELIGGAAFFAIQLLCDFNGYTLVAKGSAYMLGVKISDNFKQPYLAISVKDFWKRWHISLTRWFTNYIYIPLGGNRCGIKRQLINILIVFCVSGLWHGASWNFIIWGILHGVYQCIEVLKGCYIHNKDVREKNFWKNCKWLKRFEVFVCVDFAWIFFRADSCRAALGYIRQLLLNVPRVSILDMGLAWYDWGIVLVAIAVMFSIDILHEKGKSISEVFFRQKIWIRGIVYLTMFWTLVLFGEYGATYDTSQFIYSNF